MSQANVSRRKAVQALRSNGMDIVNAIMVIEFFIALCFENGALAMLVWQ